MTMNKPYYEESPQDELLKLGTIDEELQEHARMLKTLCSSALEDDNETFSSKASAFSAYTNMLKELIKVGERSANIGRIIALEATMIETARAHLTQQQMNDFLTDLEDRLLRLEESQ